MLSKDPDLLKVESYPKFMGLRVAAWVEIFAFFCIASLLSPLFKTDINYFNISPHPYWVLVILMSVQYGTNEGLVAAFISTLFLELGPVPIRNILQDKSEYILLLAKTPILWFVTAVVLGELRLKQIYERDQLREAALEAFDKEEKIAESYNSLKKLKERLEIHVASEMQTTLMVISAFRDLEERGEQGETGVIKGAIELTKTLVAPEKCSIFMLEDGVLQCQGINGWEVSDEFKDHFGPDSPLFDAIINKRETLSLYISDPNILQNEGVLAVPIQSISDKQVFGMIKVEQIPVTRLNTTTIETLHLIGEWVGKTYANYLAHKVAIDL